MKSHGVVAAEIINKVPYLNLATTSKSGEPWNTPLWFAKDDRHNLYFISPKNTVHTGNIASNDKCFVTIYDSMAPMGEGVGVYIEGRVEMVEGATDILRAIKIIFQGVDKKRKSIDFMSTSPKRIYKITPVKLWINNVKKQSGRSMDYRIEVSKNELMESDKSSQEIA